jgi:5-methylcytosine-specific restriction endonuclease McrA
MSLEKKNIREQFRREVLMRDGLKCRICGFSDGSFDAHHITPREDMPNGGYVKENGITLCPDCHIKAEVSAKGEMAIIGWCPKELYDLINSSYEKAVEASNKMQM